MIRAGTMEEACKDSGRWVFVDLGYSKEKRTCGLLFGDKEPETLTFGGMKEHVLDFLSANNKPINLVLEAPLSCCFSSSGNPTGRSIEKRPGEGGRYWYLGAGAAVLLPAFDLMAAIRSADQPWTIRLFEGFASFKTKAPSSHAEDVLKLRDIIWNPKSALGRVVPPDELQQDPRDVLQSVFLMAGSDYGVPPVIVVGA